MRIIIMHIIPLMKQILKVIARAHRGIFNRPPQLVIRCIIHHMPLLPFQHILEIPTLFVDVEVREWMLLHVEPAMGDKIDAGAAHQILQQDVDAMRRVGLV